MQVQILSFNKHRRLSIVQFATTQQNTFDYISGPKAISKELIEVREVSMSGSVNNLELVNLSDKFVFFMDGDILVGAKQNRVLNTSVLVAPNSKLNLPVSCVEQGRWRSVSSKFRPSDYISPDIIRAKKLKAVTGNLKKGRGHFADQSEVWDSVNEFSAMLDSYSPSFDLFEIIDKKKDKFEDFINNFPIDNRANGLAIFTDTLPLSIDLFNRTDIYQEYYPKRLRSSAMEVYNLSYRENPITEAEAKFKTLNIFDELEKAEHTIHNGVGVGTEKRYENEKFVAMELSYNSHLIHLALLNLEKVN